jgi:hypothetical protein
MPCRHSAVPLLGARPGQHNDRIAEDGQLYVCRNIFSIMFIGFTSFSVLVASQPDDVAIQEQKHTATGIEDALVFVWCEGNSLCNFEPTC